MGPITTILNAIMIAVLGWGFAWGVINLGLGLMETQMDDRNPLPRIAKGVGLCVCTFAVYGFVTWVRSMIPTI